jgi:hypothetical protein
MLPLEAAIQTLYGQTTAVTAVLGPTLWGGRAPEGTSMPFAVYAAVAAPLSQTYSSKFSLVVMQFAAYGPDRDAVGAAFYAWITALDSITVLSLTAGSNFDVLRLDDPTPTLIPDVDERSTDVWRWSCRYRFAVRNP